MVIDISTNRILLMTFKESLRSDDSILLRFETEKVVSLK